MAITMVNQPVLSHEWDFCLRESEENFKRVKSNSLDVGEGPHYTHLSRPVSL